MWFLEKFTTNRDSAISRQKSHFLTKKSSDVGKKGGDMHTWYAQAPPTAYHTYQVRVIVYRYAYHGPTGRGAAKPKKTEKKNKKNSLLTFLCAALCNSNTHSLILSHLALKFEVF